MDGTPYNIGSSNNGYPNQCGAGNFMDGPLGQIISFDLLQHSARTLILEFSTSLNEDAWN